jgi:glycosyltransferase involved in cell wall biosynthesis
VPAAGPKRDNLLFVGSKKYLQGARTLVDAFRVLKQEYPDLQLHIVGMKWRDLGKLPDGVTCHGYVDKGSERGRKLYYSLLQDAKVFINTTPRWAAFSATIEAMYFYVPVIVTPYLEFVKTFGRDIDFGIYCDDPSVDLLCATLRRVLDHEAYPTLCTNAHEAVKDFTWSAYIDKLLEKMREKL